MRHVSTRLLRDVWALARPYWVSEERWAARGLLLVILGMNLGLVYLNVLFNEWNRLFYDALQNKDFPEFRHQLLRFAVLAALFIIIAVYQTYLNQMLQIRWRRWLTAGYLEQWLDGRTYYRMQLVDAGTDNPDQRISEDLRLFVADTLTLSLGLVSALVTLGSFVGILWALSGPLTLPLAGGALPIPGYMVWCALLYAIGGTWLTHRVGRPIIRLNFDQQRYEADFRYALVRFRENAEGVALYRGEADEARVFRERFSRLMRNWWDIMKRQKRLTWLTSGYAQLAVIFPVLVASPRYFAGTIGLGGLMQIASAFGNVQGALSWFVDAYTQLAGWKATVDRLTGFRLAMEEAQRPEASLCGIVHAPSEDASVHIDLSALSRPDGQRLVADVSAVLSAGESVLLTGPSGSGKSTLFRAIAGIWPFGRGSIRSPSRARSLFLPQRAYLPIGELHAAVCYPAPPSRFDPAAVRKTLVEVGLGKFLDRLAEERNWSLELSPGEQQRLALARALLHRPDWLFLDEATSALDEASEARLYALLHKRLPGTALCSIGHRSTLARFHPRRLEILPHDGAPAELAAASEIRESTAVQSFR